LSHLFRIFVPTQQPACKVESGVDMGQHELFEAPPVFGIQIVQGTSSTNAASVIKTFEPTILFSNSVSFLTNTEEKTETH
jgi:hypothetical protein